MLILQFLIIFVPLIMVLLLSLLLAWPDLIYIVLAINSLLIFYTVWQFSRKSKVDKKWQNYIITPILFHISTIFFFTLAAGWKLIALLFFLNYIFLYLHFRTLYYFLIKPSQYQEYSLENISLLGAIFTFFFLTVGGFGYNLFLEISIWTIIAGVAILNFLIYYQVLSHNGIEVKRIILFSLFISVVFIEIFWSIYFLPIKYYIAGFILTLINYIILAFTRFYLLKRLNQRVVKLYLGYAAVCLAAVLLTARWL